MGGSSGSLDLNNKMLEEIKMLNDDHLDKIKFFIQIPDTYLEIYKKAREKAKQARMEAIKAYLTVKEIKKQYLLEEIDLSEEETDEEDFLFSEK